MPDIHEILRTYWGYDSFRPLQEDIIRSVLNGQDTLAMLPTGGGKSLCFQVPGMYLDGLTIVISPLIALMKDQVANLQSRNISATYINSALSHWEIDRRLQAAMDGTYKFLYIAPERIHAQMFRLRLPNMKVALLVVDEAHCISQWGYDFRPAYLDIHLIRKAKPQIPVIALTASAIPAVQQDIIDKLAFQKHKLFRQSFRRQNLRYFVLREENISLRIVEMLRRTQGTGIIYVRTRKAGEALAKHLQDQQLSAIAYHGGMSHSERNRIQEAWIRNEYRVIVATNAFGMGIDKPDVRFVLHYQLPADLESYYQEAGRAGRDGKTALAIAFLNPSDLHEAERWAKEKYPAYGVVEQCFQTLCKHYKIANQGEVSETVNFDVQTFAKDYGLNPKQLYASLRLLHQEGFVRYEEEKEDFGYIQAVCPPDEWLQYAAGNTSHKLLMEMVLRNMGGAIFQQEVAFLPDTWARALNVGVEDLEKQLAQLAQKNILLYTPPTNSPTLGFLKNAASLSQNALNWSKYSFLQAQADWRWEQLKTYITQNQRCRSLYIQAYFGEQDSQNCGKCDVCVERNKRQDHSLQTSVLYQSLLDYVQKHPQTTYRETIQLAQFATAAQREEALRYLMDKGIIEADLTGKLRVKN